MDFLTFLYALSTLLAGAIGTLKSNEMMRDNRLVEAIAWKKGTTNSLIKKLYKPTPFGWAFIVCIVLSVSLSILKEIKNDQENKRWQSKVEEMNNVNQASASIYTQKLEEFNSTLIRSDTLHTQMFIEYNKQLDKWGLEIRDSMIVRKEQYPLLRVYTEEVVFKEMGDSTFIELKLINKGDAIAEKVNYAVFFGCKFDGKIKWFQISRSFEGIMGVNDFFSFSSLIFSPKYQILYDNECYIQVEGKFCKYKSKDCGTFCYAMVKRERSEKWGVIDCTSIKIDKKEVNTSLFWNWLQRETRRR